ncbi:MAG TPA: hypothetical protein VIV66_13970 [Pyrinomonadaceae bacterium]
MNHTTIRATLGLAIQGRGKLANCQSCHLMKPDTDFIFRTYLNEEAKQQLQ